MFEACKFVDILELVLEGGNVGVIELKNQRHIKMTDQIKAVMKNSVINQPNHQKRMVWKRALHLL